MPADRRTAAEPREFLKGSRCAACDAKLEVLPAQGGQPLATRCVCCGRIEDFEAATARCPGVLQSAGVPEAAARLGALVGSAVVLMLWGDVELVRVPLALAWGLALLRQWVLQPVFDGAAEPALVRAAFALEADRATVPLPIQSLPGGSRS